MACQTHSLGCLLCCHTVHFKHQTSFLNNCDEVIHSTFSGSHRRFVAVGCDWLIRKNSNPNFATALDISGHGPAGGFNLSGCYPAVFQSLQTETSECHKIPRHGLAFGCSSMMFSVLNFFRN